MRHFFASLAIASILCGSLNAEEPPKFWPQAAGPNGDWHLAADAPTHWSVARNENIRWRTKLPNAGQSGIVIMGDKLFLTTFAEQDEKAKRQSNTILGHAVDRATGKILWSVTLQGGRPSPQLYAYSDSTSWTPICDEKTVCFFNSSGEMGCWDHSGKEIWRRSFRTQPDKYPFNRQCEPILHGDVIITVEPIGKDEPGFDAKRDDWNYLHAIDRFTGKLRWIAEDPCTFYCTPCFGHLPDGRPAVVHGRGGPHGVPETPIGLSMTSLAKGEEGKTVWRFSPEAKPGAPLDGTTWMALYTNVWDKKYVYWFRNAPEEAHVVLDAATGKLVREQSLVKSADVRQWNSEKKAYVSHENVNIRDLPDPAFPLKAGEVLHVLPQWHANMAANGWHWFLCTTNNRRNGRAPKGHSGPAYALGRIHAETGKVEYLELPVGVERKTGEPDQFVYGRALKTRTVDNQGREIADEDRSRTDGWQVDAFFPTPVVLGDKLYITVMLGVTYVIDTKATVLDQKALLAVNDLGPLGDTWSLSGPSSSQGVLYHRSAKELVAIDKK
ncbi:outer membrane protein assembly factor BamB family protein [Zavarzinella formosa]|uniref:outer membrane protein assembly factor BamB family protein n=1 Tax=Zavarzinella formosa TaxID=360055 RepID=UPI0002FA1A54|nr:PQQ-binding-like beta-propeller repeat protein [Zavarzinella formosa]